MLNDQDKCSICNSQPQDLLILQCKHNLCVECAVEVHALNLRKQYLVCEICLTQTALDSETIEFLAKQIIITQKLPTIPEKLPPKPSLQNSRKKDNLCHEHKQSNIYYCFDCETDKICSQCILTTKHANHRVETIKNALKTIRKRISQYCNFKISLKQRLMLQKSNAYSHKEFIKQYIHQQRSQMQTIFDEIIQVVSEKYSELKKQLGDIEKRNIEIVQGSIFQIEQRITEIQESIEFQQKMLAQKKTKDILQYFNQFKNQLDSVEDNHLALPQIKIQLNNFQQSAQHLRDILSRITWSAQLQNSFAKDNSIAEPSFLSIQQSRLRASHQNSSKINGSYSGNRKLQLSRSINNATNIINKLQSRIKAST